ncbi:MAG: DNA polymerase IV [Candidatus Saccharibacteria bacterium]|nr:DNA polymerase IV [Candidatus Saccharibacteria bacterium]
MPEILRRPPNDILYVDLNSCFATIEQQCRPMLRGRPVAITNRLVPNSCIIAASYEAKAQGVKVGMRSREASIICPDLIYAETEPDKFIFVHEKLRNIMNSYSPSVVMKSIDEGVIDLTRAPKHIYERDRFELGLEIKQRLKDEIGCYMRCNVGIASNRFLAKLAGELHKPDGLDEITEENQRAVFATLKLTDLPGINVRMEARLNAVGIFTPLQFLDADEATLVKLVCKSIDGSKWYRRLRGIEVDSTTSDIKTIGRQFVLDGKHLSRNEIEARFVHLAEDVGYRLRSKQLYARGIYVWTYDFEDGYKHCQTIAKEAFNSDADISRFARQLYNKLPDAARIIGITLYKLQAQPDQQLCLYQAQKDRINAVCIAEDKINLRFGSRKIHSADSLGTDQVKCKIPFGSTRYLDHSI